MVKALSKHIVEKLIKNDEINEDDRELYEYAVINVIMSFAPVIMALLFGLLMGKATESLLIIIPYAMIRKFAGGFHFNSMLMCFIFSSAFLVDVILISGVITDCMGLKIVLVISIVIILIISPIDNDNRRLDKEEKYHCWKWTFLLVVVFSLLYLLMLMTNGGEIAKCIAIGIIITAILQLPSLPELIVKKG